MGMVIKAVGVKLGTESLSNEDLVRQQRVPYSAEDIRRKTGISVRRVANSNESPAWLAAAACRAVFASGVCKPEDVRWIVFCTHTPDFTVPSSACVLHGLLDLPLQVGAFDVGLSCTGYVYSLVICDGLAQKLDDRGRILLINADTYTRYLAPDDASMATLFGDAATVTVLGRDDDPDYGILGHLLCTQGAAYEHLMRRSGGSRNQQGDPYIRMNGAEVFRFVQRVVPENVSAVLRDCGISGEDVAYYLLHQGSEYMITTLRQRMQIDTSRLPIRIDGFGNTVSASIPLLLHTLGKEGAALQKRVLLICGFGAGLSYGSVVLRTSPNSIAFL